MRVHKELKKGDIKISVFIWNNKYLLKFEQGLVEQTFKVNESDVLEEGDLDSFLSGDFLSEVEKRFEEMHKSLRNQIENI
ncbi:hypothetical protein [Pleomorphovibrio marinus]|uniref:hypothetical protein n=1 Tax=Pleomorphovibrio marinus TaxID=2164132 RepID=UPI000E0A53C0|nr:hypothetical protein [Pleomorphovibrio marinus]